MKLRWYDRLLVALSGLTLLGIAVLIALIGCGTVTLPEFLSVDMVRGGWRMTPLFVLAAIVVAAWGLHLVLRCLRSAQKENGRQYFTVDAGEKQDELSISVQALDHLVRRCLEQTPGVLSGSIRIEGEDKGIRISIRATLCADVRIPETVSELQSLIRTYIEECAGIYVSSVQVVVEATKIASPRKKQSAAPLLPAVKQIGAEAAPKTEILSAAEESFTETKLSEENFSEESLLDETVEPELIPQIEPEEIPCKVDLEEMSGAPMTEEEKDEQIRAQARDELDQAIGTPEKLPVELSGDAFPFPKDDNE